MTDDSIGIDISKDHLDAHRLSDGAARRFKNTSMGFRALRRWIGAALPSRVVFEPTGAYHSAFEQVCAPHLPLVKINPLQARRFAQSRGVRAKTDAVDARMLAEMGCALAMEPDAPAAKDRPVLRELQAARTALVKEKVRAQNQLAQQSQPLTRKLTKARLRQIKTQIGQIDVAIRTQIETCPARQRALILIESIPGIGPVLANTMLIEMPEIGTLSKKAVASLAGLAPMTRQSGKWRGRAFIQGGRKPLRDALYMPALVAIRHNPDFTEKYNQMKALGKPSKVAITTIMRKLLILANTLVKEDRKWTQNLT